MGKANCAIVPFFKNKEHFADLFNAMVFEGRQLVVSDDLEIIDSESDIILEDKNEKKRGVQRYRDIIMRWRNRVTLAILACGIQDEVHYAMPVRTMIYDGMAYADQIKQIWESLSTDEKRELNSKEFLSHFRKNDKLTPVITLVFYYGDNWDGSVELHDMFDINDKLDKGIIEKYIPNYHINLVNPSDISDYSVFKTDLHIIFNMLKYKNNTKELIEYTDKNKKYFSSVDRDTAYAISALLHSEKWLDNVFDNEEKEKKNVCKALQDLYDEGVSTGIEQGISKGKTDAIKEMVTILREMSVSDNEIVNKLMSHFDMNEITASMYL